MFEKWNIGEKCIKINLNPTDSIGFDIILVMYVDDWTKRE